MSDNRGLLNKPTGISFFSDQTAFINFESARLKSERGESVSNSDVVRLAVDEYMANHPDSMAAFQKSRESSK